MVILGGRVFLMSEVPLYALNPEPQTLTPQTLNAQVAGPVGGGVGVAARIAPLREQEDVKRFRGGLVFKAHRLLCHSTLGLRLIKKKKKRARRRLALRWASQP